MYLSLCTKRALKPQNNLYRIFSYLSNDTNFNSFRILSKKLWPKYLQVFSFGIHIFALDSPSNFNFILDLNSNLI